MYGLAYQLFTHLGPGHLTSKISEYENSSTSELAVENELKARPINGNPAKIIS